MQDRTSRHMLWFMAGLGIGTAAGLLAAPKPGTETRRLLAGKTAAGAHELSGYLTVSGREYLDRSRELYEHGLRLAEEAAELFEEGRRLMDMADAARHRS